MQTSTQSENELKLVRVKECDRRVLRTRRRQLHFARVRRRQRSRELKRRGIEQ